VEPLSAISEEDDRVNECAFDWSKEDGTVFDTTDAEDDAPGIRARFIKGRGAGRPGVNDTA